MDKIKVEENILKRNNELAGRLRKKYRDNQIKVLNIIGSPGAGKTSLLERTLPRLTKHLLPGIIEGDVLTDRDAARIKKLGLPTVQIETGGACHLDARMVDRALKDLKLSDLNLLFIENVGNLVCPASFDLGEDYKVVVISVAEGSDKPAKYPEIFNRASVCVLNKIDLLDYNNFSRKEFYADIEHVNPELEVFEVSATTGKGLEKWLNWLEGIVTYEGKEN